MSIAVPDEGGPKPETGFKLVRIASIVVEDGALRIELEVEMVAFPVIVTGAADRLQCRCEKNLLLSVGNDVGIEFERTLKVENMVE